MDIEELEKRKKLITDKAQETFERITGDEGLEMIDELSDIIEIYLNVVTVENYYTVSAEFLDQITVYEASHNL